MPRLTEDSYLGITRVYTGLLNYFKFIYLLISPSNKVYVGQTKDLKTRWRDYKNYRCKKQPKLYNALKKYGSDNFKFVVMDYCRSQEAANNKEIFYIRKHDSIANGYNCLIGGNISLSILNSYIKMSLTKKEP